MASASPALAEFGMSVRVCNRGEVSVSAALAYEDSNLTSSYWVADGWFTIPANRCMTLYDKSRHEVCYDDVNLTPCARVRIVYVFKDSTGVLGTADVRDSRFEPGGETMCVNGTGPFKERRSALTSGCGRPGWYLVPVAVKIDTYRGNGPDQRYLDFQGTTLNVALSSRDRARPFPGEAGEAVEGLGTSDEFVKLLRVAMNAPSFEEGLRDISSGRTIQLKSGYRWAHVCVSRQVMSRESLSNSSTARAKAITNAIRQYLASHGKGTTGFRVTEPNGAIALEPFDGKTEDCVRRGDLQYKLQSAESER